MPSNTPPAVPEKSVRWQYSITMEGSMDDVQECVDAIGALRQKLSHRYLGVRFGHMVEDSNDGR